MVFLLVIQFPVLGAGVCFGGWRFEKRSGNAEAVLEIGDGEVEGAAVGFQRERGGGNAIEDERGALILRFQISDFFPTFA
jgi:hypothetical protein